MENLTMTAPPTSTNHIANRLPTLPVPSDAEFSAAKRLYAEQWGDAVVTNTYLKLTIAALCLLCAGSLYISYNAVKKMETFHFRWFRVDGIGRVEEVQENDVNYKPQDKEIKYFLAEFCRLYYSRNRLTLRDNFKQSLLFLDTPLADSTLASWTKNHTLDNYQSGTDPIQEVKVNRIDIEDLRNPPYKATIEYELSYISPIDHSELKRIQYTAHFVFALREVVSNDLIQTNPIGLSIIYFREDEALH
jgi:type IV secretory pathway TrbF-like protein